MKKHILVGVSAGVILFLIYLGIIAFAESFQHALKQTAEMWYWVAALVAGFGIQAGLFSFVRQGLREQRASATASVATCGSVSTGAMVACCAHHLTDVLPLLGLSGLVVFLARYQVLFLIAGVLSNMVGITIMLELIQHHGLSAWVTSWKWNLGQVKKGVIVSAALIFVATTFGTLFVS